jgi:ligand-binding sensor domain-containing protein
LNASSTCRSVRASAALVVATWLAWTTATTALDRERAMTQYTRDEWESDRGFPGGQVYAIAQTTDGYLWIAAEKGLVRFDGLRFRLFELRGTSANSGPTVLGVAAAADGSLWARLRGVGLMRYRDGVFENMVSSIGPPETIVSAMVRGRNDAMLVATLGFGTVAYRGGRFETIMTEKEMPSSSFVIAIADSETGESWLGTRGAGLMRVKGTRVTRLTDGLPDLKINCLLATSKSELWIGTDKGIARWTGEAITRVGIPPALQDLPTLAMLRDRDGNVWIAAGPKGLLRVDRAGVVSAADRAPGNRRHVSTLFEDREGNLWVGGDRGIERWRDPVFTTYSTAQGLPADTIGPLFVDGQDRTWFAPTTGGLYWLRDGVIQRVTQGGLDRDVVYSIDGGSDDVWVGRQRGGLSRLKPRGVRFAVERLTRANGLAQDSVYAVHRGRDGAIWAGTLSGGVSRYKDGAFVSYDMTQGLASNTVTSILDTAEGTIWFATPNGLSALSRGGWRTYKTTDGLPSNDANTLFEDRDGNLWVGTAAGLAVLHAGAVRTLPAFPPVLRASIVGVAEDNTGSLWIATGDRVLRVDRHALLNGAVDAIGVRDYGVRDGLLALEGVKRQHSVVSDGRGRIWLSLARGLSRVDPAHADPRALPTSTHVEEITADGEAVDTRATVQIPAGRRRIAFNYTGLNLSLPERIMFRYRLDGFDAEWSAPGANRQAVYTNLGPRAYRFRVVASSGDGVWNGSETVLAFEVLPMFWQTLWFRTVTVLLVATLVWGVYRLRLLQVAKRLNLRFEERLDERTQIARELHDTLLQGFVSASMQLHVAVERLPEGSAAKPAMGRVLDLMRRVIDEGRNAVTGLRASAGPADDLEHAFSGIQKGAFRASCRVPRHHRWQATGAEPDDPRRGLSHRPGRAAERLPPFERVEHRNRAGV